MKRGRTKRVIVVDDHPIVRKGLKAILAQEEDLLLCGEAESAGEALKVINLEHPDIIIVDIGLKGSDGLELIKSIRYQDERIPVLVMSMYDESLYCERALRAGANGYIMKEAVDENIVHAIRHLLRGEIYVSDGIRQRILHGITKTGTENAVSPIERLSDRELEVFRLIGTGRSTRQISEQLHLSIKTIETYRAHIKEKLNLTNASELVQSAVQWVEKQK